MRRVEREKDDETALPGAFGHDDRSVDEALEWFVRLRDGSSDATTRAEFALWRAQSPRHAEEYGRLETLWGSAPFRQATEALRPASSRGAFAGARRLVARFSAQWATQVAAAAVIALIAVGAWRLPALMLRWQADYLTDTGDRRTVELPDGSTMILDTASAVAVDFHGGRRRVRLLQGEAFFDVKRDPTHPFRVTGRFGETEVRGTAFSMRADAEEERIILERGLVTVSLLSDDADRVDLAPNQMVVAKKDALSSVTPVDPRIRLAWRDGRIIFENQPFSRVLAELRRYYKRSVFVADERVDHLVVTGNYRLDDVEGAIRTLADAAGLTVYRLPVGIVILR